MIKAPSAQAEYVPDFRYHKARLKNGITLVVESHPRVRSVSIGIWVKVGSSYETPEINGVSHFLEHMVFKGTERRSPLEIATVLESLGGDLNAFTDREFTCFHATTLSEHVDVALDVMSDIVIRPTFPKDEMERERRVLLQELSMVEEAPDDCISDMFFSTVWKGDPLGQSVIGKRKTIKSISRAQLVNYFKTHYHSENIVISIAGNVDFEDVKAKCEHYFADCPVPKRKPKPVKPSHFHSRKKAILMDTEQLHLLIGFEGAGFKDPFRFDALILSFFLGGGMSSRLFQEIREKAGLAYSVDCDCVPFSETGVLSIYVALGPKSLKECLGILSREIERLKTVPLTEKEINTVKGQLKGTILLSSDHMETRQESLGRNEIIFGRYISVEEVIAELERVSPDRVLALAQRIFVPERQAVVTLGKFKPEPSTTTVI